MEATSQPWYVVQKVESDTPDGPTYKLVYRPAPDAEFQGRIAFAVTKEEYDAAALGNQVRVALISPVYT